MLHSQVLRLILDHPSDPNRRQVLVLLSGDGNSNSGRTSFPYAVTTALQRNWQVELWSWEQSLSRNFRDIERKYPAQMKINYLDPHRKRITFIGKTKTT